MGQQNEERTDGRSKTNKSRPSLRRVVRPFRSLVMPRQSEHSEQGASSRIPRLNRAARARGRANQTYPIDTSEQTARGAASAENARGCGDATMGMGEQNETEARLVPLLLQCRPFTTWHLYPSSQPSSVSSVHTRFAPFTVTYQGASERERRGNDREKEREGESCQKSTKICK